MAADPFQYDTRVADYTFTLFAGGFCDSIPFEVVTGPWLKEGFSEDPLNVLFAISGPY